MSQPESGQWRQAEAGKRVCERRAAKSDVFKRTHLQDSCRRKKKKKKKGNPNCIERVNWKHSDHSNYSEQQNPPPPPPKCVALVYLTHFVIGAMSQAWLRKRKTGPGRKQAEKKKPDIIVRRPDTVTAENCE